MARGNRGFPRRERPQAPAAPPAPPPRAQRNAVRAAVAGVFSGAASLYQTLCQVVEAGADIPPEAQDYLLQACSDFASFHDSLGAALGELAPSHHDRDLWVIPEEG